MKIKFGSIITAGSGKIGGHVATKNRGGAVLRTKVSPSNSQTVRQSAVRSLFANLSQAWSTLTQAQRDAWNAAVSGFSKTDIFGDVRNPSGINLFQKLNNVLSNCGIEILTDPPTPSLIPSLIINSLTAAVAVPAMSIDLSGIVPADSAVIVFATAPMSQGKNYVKSEFRQIAILANATESPFNLLAAYTAKFGSTGQIGQKIYVKITNVNTLTGQAGSPSVKFVITSA